MMADVTVTGVQGTTVTIPISSAQNAQIAQQLLAEISAGEAAGTITPYTTPGFGPITAPAGQSALFISTPGLISIPSTTGTVIDTATAPTILFGGNAAQQNVVSGVGGLNYTTNLGVGTVIAGGGANVISTALTGGGNHLILTDNGNDAIFAWSGNDTISAGGGENSIVLGSGNDLVQVTGQDTVMVGTGAATIGVTSGNALVYGGAGKLTFINDGQDSTVMGGTGSVTVEGGGGGVFHGGTDGNNLLIGGEGATTLFGGGNNDQLFGIGTGNDLLVAGSGNESLFGLGSGNDTLKAGSGNDVITGGSGANTLVAGTGNATLTGGPSTNVFSFVDGQAGGHVVITDFTLGTDSLSLQGYGHDALSKALDHATVAGGSTTISLADHTTITFQNVVNLDMDHNKLS
jgi:Ca2+-binding RTX toxin-like protein